jgi:hypothetical protein
MEPAFWRGLAIGLALCVPLWLLAILMVMRWMQ